MQYTRQFKTEKKKSSAQFEEVYQREILKASEKEYKRSKEIEEARKRLDKETASFQKQQIIEKSRSKNDIKICPIFMIVRNSVQSYQELKYC